MFPPCPPALYPSDIAALLIAPFTSRATLAPFIVLDHPGMFPPQGLCTSWPSACKHFTQIYTSLSLQSFLVKLSLATWSNKPDHLCFHVPLLFSPTLFFSLTLLTAEIQHIYLVYCLPPPLECKLHEAFLFFIYVHFSDQNTGCFDQ